MEDFLLFIFLSYSFPLHSLPKVTSAEQKLIYAASLFSAFLLLSSFPSLFIRFLKKTQFLKCTVRTFLAVVQGYFLYSSEKIIRVYIRNKFENGWLDWMLPQ